MGIADAVIEGGVKITALHYWANGAWGSAGVPFGRIGEGLSPYPFPLIFPQDAHERLLIEQLDALGVRVERRTELVRSSEHDGCVRPPLSCRMAPKRPQSPLPARAATVRRRPIAGAACDRLLRRYLRRALLRRRRAGGRASD